MKFLGLQFTDANTRGKCFVFVVSSLVTFVPLYYFLYILTQDELYSTYHFFATSFQWWDMPLVYRIMAATVDAYVILDVLAEFLVHASIIYICILSTNFWLQKVR